MSGNDDRPIAKNFAALDRRLKHLYALLPPGFREGTAVMDDDQLAAAELITDEIGATVRDMEKLLCSR